MEKDKMTKVFLFIVLMILLLASMGIRGCVAQEEDTGREKTASYSLPQREKEEKKNPVDKRQIYNMKAQAEDNISPAGEAENVDDGMELIFTGYENHEKEFSWLQDGDWENFQRQLKAYLDKKKLEVTTVTLHADSQQVIGEDLRYLYLDVDYATEYSDRLLIKAICDTYTGTLRFAFEIQYGD